MGRRTDHRPRPRRAASVVAVSPERGGARHFVLWFTSRGVELHAGGRAPDPVGSTGAGGYPSAGAGSSEPTIVVPWWALREIGVPDGAPGSSAAAPEQRMELVTDAGTLTLRATPSELGAALEALMGWGPRWRRWRRPAVRTGARLAVLGAGAARASARRLGDLGERAARPVLAATRSVPGDLRVPRTVWAAAALAASLAGLVATSMVVTASSPHPGGPASSAPTSPSPGASSSAPPGAGGSPRTAGAASAGAASAIPSWWGIAETLKSLRFEGTAGRLLAATTPPPPLPPAVADEPPLSPHEVFGFVPYWALHDQASIDVSAYTTLAYFALDAAADGALVRSGTGWDGYQSAELAQLVARAHAAGVRVVLTVKCFTNPALEALTTSASAQATLASQIVTAVAAKNLDGVNLDFEGEGNQAGLTALVAAVAQALHTQDAHYQVTVDTDASSAGDPGTLYDVGALARVADGLFVMAYGLNLASQPNGASPLTSGEFSDAEAARQYASVVPASKVIFGVPYFGYEWPTTNGTMRATAVGPAVAVSDATIEAAGHPLYWDQVTGTAWTSYERGQQWYEAYFTDPASVYLVAQLAARSGFAGVGAWAVGMDGFDPEMAVALDGNAPPAPAELAGPAWTTASSPPAGPATPLGAVGGVPPSPGQGWVPALGPGPAQGSGGVSSGPRSPGLLGTSSSATAFSAGVPSLSTPPTPTAPAPAATPGAPAGATAG